MLIDCPDCNGTGAVNRQPLVAGNSTYIFCNTYEGCSCNKCGGTGSIRGDLNGV